VWQLLNVHFFTFPILKWTFGIDGFGWQCHFNLFLKKKIEHLMIATLITYLIYVASVQMSPSTCKINAIIFYSFQSSICTFKN